MLYKSFGIIHLFAVLHAAVATLCRLAEVNDELILTLLTIMLVCLICLKRGVNLEFTTASIIIVNVIGYLMGTWSAELFERIVHSPLAVHALSTFLTTEVIGWSIVWFIKFFHRGDPRRPHWKPRIGVLLLAVGVIFVCRLAYAKLFAQPSFNSMGVYDMIELLTSSSAAIIILVGVNLLFVRYMRRHATMRTSHKFGVLILFLAVISIGVTLLAGTRHPFGVDRTFTWLELLQCSSITLLIEIVIYSTLFMVDYAIAAQAGLRIEKDKTHLAQFRYMKLKQQVNPHFLFNSLNILDCLVCEKRTEQASAYIHKLAGIYRYMLQNEEEAVVRLKEELAFVAMYVDLLQVRFAEGFSVETDVPEEALQRSVVPCSVQLLIENAFKHNAVDSAEPLRIRISTSEEGLTISNTLRPKISGVPSTGVGLNYIRQQYLDLAGIPIEIERTETEYRVTLPLL